MLAADARLAAGHFLFLSLVYRFNAIADFRGFNDRLKQSRALRRLAFKEGLPSRRWLGIPLARSRGLFAMLRGLYFSGWQRHVQVEELFADKRPDVLVITHLQTSAVTPYVLAARARGVPILGINGSWDQPTTKGPMVPGIAHVLAQSRQVVDDLARFHGFPPERTSVVGWPQMDIYADRSRLMSRTAFLERIGLAEGSRYILLAAYTERLGKHEPALCRALQEEIGRGTFGPQAALFIRSHPLDREWRQRLGPLANSPTTIVEPPDLGTLDHLSNLIHHADVVVASAGTINLDAMAHDTPSIALAFEDAGVPHYDSSARRYDMEHIAAVMATGGIRRVGSIDELIAAVRGYMADRNCDADGRARLRALVLEPLDGAASARIAAAIGQFARDHEMSQCDGKSAIRA